MPNWLKKFKHGFIFTKDKPKSILVEFFFTTKPNNQFINGNAITNEVTVFKEDAGRSNGYFFMLDAKIGRCCGWWENSNFGWIDKEALRKLLGKCFSWPRNLNGPMRSGFWFQKVECISQITLCTSLLGGTRGKRVRADGEACVLFICRQISAFGVVTEDLIKPKWHHRYPWCENTLYSQIQEQKRLLKWDPRHGYLINKSFSVWNGALDGMTIDWIEEISTWLVMGWPFNKFREDQIAHITVPAKWTSNVAFWEALDR